MSPFRQTQAHRRPLLPLALFGAYALSAAAASSATIGIGGLPVLWINNGLLAAGLLILPRRPAILLAALCTLTDVTVIYLSGSSLARTLLICGCDLTEAVGAAVLLRRVGGAALNVTDLRRLPAMVLFAILPACLTVATTGSLLSALFFGTPFQSLWITWVSSDVLGMVIGLPATLLFTRPGRFENTVRASVIERVLWSVSAAGAGWFIFQISPASQLYLVYPVALLLILRLSPPFAMLAILLFSVVAASATVLGQGPIARGGGDPSERILWLQVYLAALQFFALALVGVLSQRLRAQTGLKRALAAARKSREVAEQAASAKGRFLAVMSHEMRTPLNGIAGYTQLLGARLDLPADASAQVRTIGESSEVLLALISDVLDYSRSESRELHLVEQPFQLVRVISNSVEIVRPLLSGRQIELRVACDLSAALTHRGDGRRLTQVLLNLLGNAIKFTERGSITVSAACQAAADPAFDEITLTVLDTGIGIPADKLDLLFNSFFQVDASDQRSFGGAGLGLAISRSLIQRMGGTIEVESREGEGSAFRVSLTLPRVETADAAIPAVVSATDPGAARVLVVDDHPVNRNVASLMLEAAGFAVATADNGALALEALEREPFDLVFMDLHMPVLDGLGACRAIRALEGPVSRIPVIAMTAAAMPEDVERCFAAGMTGHVAKPIRQDELLGAALAQLETRDQTAAADRPLPTALEDSNRGSDVGPVGYAPEV